MIKRSIRGLYLVLALCIAVGSSVQAQIKTTTFNDKTVKENSIVVKFDDTMITAKGKAVAPKTLAATVRTAYNASIGRTIDAQNVEEWIVSGDMNSVLSELNKIPGVRAFPNYVFYRDEMEVTPFDFSSQLQLVADGENPFPGLETMYGPEIINNGDFSAAGFQDWTTYNADFAGVFADFSNADSVARITNITGPNDQIWYIQLFQELTIDQLDALNIGGLYELNFTASTDSATKDLNVFVGQNSGDFLSHLSQIVTLTPGDSTYTLQFYMNDVWYFEGMKVAFEGGTSDASIFVDDVSLRQANSPVFAAQTPDVPEDMVISLFSDAYTNVPVDTFRTVWSDSKFEIDVVDGDEIIIYDSLNFVGIETVANQLDVTEMSHVRFNVWTPNADELRFKLVDFGPDGVYSPAFDGGDDTEYEVIFTDFPKSTWLIAEIPLYVFEGMNFENIAQIIFAASPVGEATVAIDNLYFYDDGLPTNDPLLTLQYGLNNDGSFQPGYSVPGADVDAFAAWDYTTGSDDVVFVVYDDGVDFSHPDLYDNAWMNPGEIPDNGIDDDDNGYVDDVYGWSSVYNDNSFLNWGSFHGTHVAGILGAQGDNGYGVSGVSQDVSIISVMIFNEFGGTDAIAIMAGYQYISDLLDSGVEITGINQSWGGGGFLDLESDQQFVSVMTDYALHHNSYGALWIVSAGNSSSNRDDLPFYSYPNNIQAPNIVTVASTDDADALSGFSDFGEFTVDVSAPGSNILSTLPPSTTGVEFGYLGGTSMASPHVSGILALAKSYYPDEDGNDLLARLFAGEESIPGFEGVVGSGGRSNAMGTLFPDSVGNDAALASGARTQFHRTFVDGVSQEVAGIVNNSGGDVTVTSMSITGPDADHFAIDTDELPTLSPTESFGVPILFDNMGIFGDLTASLEIETDAGTASLALIGHEQGFPFPYIDPVYHNFGSVPYGEELTTSFTLFNDGNSDLFYDLQQGLFYYDLEWSWFSESITTFEPENSNIEKAAPGDDVEMLDEITTRVMLERGDRKLPKITYEEGMHPRRELDGPEEVFFDDLNDNDAVAENWELLSFGVNEDYFELYDWDFSEDTNNVFLFGDFDFGYQNDAISVAIPPAFDFSALEQGRGPAYLVFDAETQLEWGYDDFYVNVISNGSRLATIAGTFDGSIPNYGGYNQIWVDISQFAGLDDVEFWFIAYTDGSVVDGFGALFDNVGVIVDDMPFFTSTGGGVIAPGESEDIDITIRTELLPPGDFVLFTDVFTNGFISYYGQNFVYHTAEFSARNVALEIDPAWDWIGEASKEEATTFDFDATNVGTVDVEYFSDVFIAYNQPVDFFGEDFVAGKDAAMGRFEVSDKGEGGDIDLVEHRNVVMEGISKRNGVTGTTSSNRVSDIPRMSPSREDLDIYFEDFETGELNESWDVFDYSFGLGHVFNVENWGSVDFPDYFLNVGGLSENGWYIYNNTYTLAFSESFDLSEIPISDATIMEFTYSFLLEPGWDFGSVWLGVETEAGIELIYGGSSEDVLWNDGGVYRMGFDISAFAGFDNVFMAFLVETDQSVQSAWAGFDDLDVYTSEKLAYIDPVEGIIDSAATQTFNVTVNTPWLWPGEYIAISVIDYYGGNEDFFVGRSAEQFTYFEIPNEKPVAEDDFLAVITNEVIPMNAILDYMLSNDYDVDGWVYLYEFSDPLFGDIKYTFDGWMYVAPEVGKKDDSFQYIITDGQKMDTATVYMSVGEEPHFPDGADKQYVFLEDEELTMSTVGMAAGVGFWENVMVWADSHDDGVFIDQGEEMHSITFSADDNLFGQFSATLYVGTDDGTAWDSLDVSIIVTPVNDAPVAEFAANIDGSMVTFTDLSSDAIDMDAGGIVSWAWDFGDGNTSTEMSPVYDYGTTGDFTVTLMVTDNGGLTNDFTGTVEIVSVSNEVFGGVPTDFAIEQNYPNPFNPSTNINYSLPEASKVSIVVYDMLGQKVAELVNAEQSAGYHTISFDASALSSGMYMYQIRAGAFTQTKKMMLIK